MNKQEPWYFEERSIAFASLMLTARDDVKVRPEADTIGVDLRAEILDAGKGTSRFFGVQLVAYMDPPENPDERVLAASRRYSEGTEGPLCVMVIGVRKPEGVWRWILEPTVEEGQALLRPGSATSWHPIDEAEMGQLIAQVNAWYDARNGNPPRPPRGRGKAKSTR